MTELLTAAQMRAIEQAAIASGEVTGLELMERAGRGVVEAIFEEWPELQQTALRAVVLCGPGNNGGDGFVVARLLKEWGWQVEVFLYGDPEGMPPEARVNYERWRGMGEVWPAAEFAQHTDLRPGASVDLFIDALFGTGLTRSVPRDACGPFAALFGSEWFAHCVAIDMPSGICADSGRPIVPMGYPQNGWPAADALACEALLTVTFHHAKIGHFIEAGQQYCRRVVVKDIGLRPAYGPSFVTRVSLAGGPAQGLGKGCFQHKYAHGHALILSGPPGRAGAARLAARGALRIGAGLVTLGCPPAALAENAAQLNAIMLRPLADAAALSDALSDKRINAICLGPGMGTTDEGRSLLATALASARPTVLDADALTLIARDPALFAMLHDTCVLTPHAGEFARLFADIAEKLDAPATRGPAYSKVDATRAAASRAGCVVLFKGPDTVIADPSGTCAINSAQYDRAAPWLATAGSGDVLSGFITGLLARGFDPMSAAETAAWLHVDCALTFGPGLIAEDLPEQLPAVFRKLGL